MNSDREILLQKIQSLYLSLGAENYDSQYTSPQYKAEDSITYSYLSRHINPSLPLLDIGCGCGEFLDVTHYHSLIYHGIDICPNMISLAKKKHPHHLFEVRDALSFSEKYPQIICLYGGYFSIDQLDLFIKRNLTPGGSIFFHFPTRSRNDTFIKKSEESLSIPMELINSQKIKTLLSRKYKQISILKINAFNKWKNNFPSPLYHFSVFAEKFLPIPVEYYTWVLIHIKN